MKQEVRWPLYEGEVGLDLVPPLDILAMRRLLYDHLFSIPEVEFLATVRSGEEGTTIMVLLSEPIPLIDILTEIPGVKATPLFDEGEPFKFVRKTANTLGLQYDLRKKIKVGLNTRWHS